MRFAYEEVLWFAAATPVAFLLLFLYDRVQRRRLATRLGDLPVLTKVMASQSPRRRVVKLVLVSLGVGLVLVAAARPQIAGTFGAAATHWMRVPEAAVAIKLAGARRFSRRAP